MLSLKSIVCGVGCNALLIVSDVTKTTIADTKPTITEIMLRFMFFKLCKHKSKGREFVIIVKMLPLLKWDKIRNYFE